MSRALFPTHLSRRRAGSPEQDGLRGMVVISSDGTIESCNASFLDILGVKSEGLAGASLSALFPEEDAASFLTTVREAVAVGVTARGQAALRGPGDGQPVVVLYQASRISDADAGSERRAEGGARRIALLVETLRENATQEDEARGFSRFSEESPFPVLRISRDGTLLSANRGSWLLLAHWKTDVGSRIPPRWQEAIEEAVRQKDAYEVEVQIGIKILLLVFVPVADKGYVNVFGLDVSSRKQAEKRLQLDAQVFESASEAVVITDMDRRILDVNRAFTSITGLHPGGDSRGEYLGPQLGPAGPAFLPGNVGHRQRPGKLAGGDLGQEKKRRSLPEVAFHQRGAG